MRILNLFALLAAVASLQAEDVKPAAELKAGEFTFKPATPWVTSDTPKPMSAGTFHLPGKDGSAGLDAAVYHFGSGQGGDVDANVARWQGQFASDPEPKLTKEELKFGEKKATLVVISGTFMSGRPIDPKKTALPDQTLLGAILESATGHVFVKLTGPSKEVAAAREEFKKLIASAYQAK